MRMRSIVSGSWNNKSLTPKNFYVEDPDMTIHRYGMKTAYPSLPERRRYAKQVSHKSCLKSKMRVSHLLAIKTIESSRNPCTSHDPTPVESVKSSFPFLLLVRMYCTSGQQMLVSCINHRHWRVVICCQAADVTISYRSALSAMNLIG